MAKVFIGEAQMPYMIISGGEVRSATDIKKFFQQQDLKNLVLFSLMNLMQFTKMIMEKKIVLSLILK